MYVKIIHPPAHRTELFEVPGDLSYGTIFVSPKDEPEAWYSRVGLESVGTTHVLLDEDALRVDPDGEHQLLHRVQWAWWDAPGVGRKLVVTLGEMYVLNDQGDTIERVR